LKEGFHVHPLDFPASALAGETQETDSIFRPDVAKDHPEGGAFEFFVSIPAHPGGEVLEKQVFPEERALVIQLDDLVLRLAGPAADPLDIGTVHSHRVLTDVLKPHIPEHILPTAMDPVRPWPADDHPPHARALHQGNDRALRLPLAPIPQVAGWNEPGVVEVN